jgi:hypothetical protein
MVASVIAASEDELVMPGDGQAVTTDGVSAAMEQETTG